MSLLGGLYSLMCHKLQSTFSGTFYTTTILICRPVNRAAVTFSADVRQFRVAFWRAVINPAGGGAKLFRRLLAARSKFVNILTSSVLLTVCAVIR